MVRFYRMLLRFLPREFRAAHEQDMRRLLSEYEKDRSWWGRMLMWARASLDVVAVGVGLRVRGLVGEGRWSFRTGFTQEVRYGVRSLRRRPGFTAVAVATLGLGIGATTGIFSVVHGVLLDPLPYAEADRIGILWHEFGDGAQDLPALHPLDLIDYRARSQLFEDFTMAIGDEWILGEQDDAEIVDVGQVESGFFEFFGVYPVVGRSFTADEDVVGAAPSAILSHRLWVRRFGADPAIVGQRIPVDGSEMAVVGVLPESFRLHLPGEAFLLRDAELWTNLGLDPSDLPPRNFTGFTGFGRLQSGVTFAQGQAEIEAMAGGLRREHPVHAASNLRARVVPLLDDVVKDARQVLLLLLGAVGFVLLIACVNVANLTVVRGHGRSHEYALRAALGAGRGGLVRLALIESTLLSIAGVVVGVVVARVGLAVLARLDLGSVPRLASVEMDSPVLLFAVAVTVFSTILFGLIPALRTTRNAPVEGLGSGGRSISTRGRKRVREMLVMGQVAACFVLLVGTGLMVRSLSALTRVEPGYGTEGALTFRISLPSPQFDEDAAEEAFQSQLLEAARALPGVTGATTISQLPLSGAGSLQPFAYDEETATNWESVSADQRSVAPGFFEVMEAELVSGRGFNMGDTSGEATIIIDERLAALAFPDGNAVGSRLQVNPNDVEESLRFAHIVGVVEHLRLHDLSRPHLPQIFQPSGGSSRFSVVVRSSLDPETLVAPLRDVLARLAPGAPMEDVRTMAELVRTSLAPDRLALGLMTAFGVVALFLASLGVYGVLAYAVTQRTREIGVRIALGQTPAAVRRVVLAEGGRIVLGALALGIIGAAILSRAASSILYEVDPLDPATYASMSAVLVAAAITACWIPARRATRVDPIHALRVE